MTEDHKIIDLIKRLKEVFPGKYICIKKQFDAHEHKYNTNRVEISFGIYTQDNNCSNQIYGIPALEAHVDMLVLNEVSKQGETYRIDEFKESNKGDGMPVCDCDDSVLCGGDPNFFCENCGGTING